MTKFSSGERKARVPTRSIRNAAITFRPSMRKAKTGSFEQAAAAAAASF